MSLTNDALLVVECLFGTIWKFFNSWYIPGTNVTPAVMMFGFLFLKIVFRFVGQFFGIWESIGSAPKDGPDDSEEYKRWLFMHYEPRGKR